jgi:hypothetical protein
MWILVDMDPLSFQYIASVLISATTGVVQEFSRVFPIGSDTPLKPHKVAEIVWQLYINDVVKYIPFHHQVALYV